MDDSTKQLYEMHAEGSSKFIYFQLGVAASAIAFSVHVTRDAALLASHWSLALAVASWALSFWSGLLSLRYRISGLSANFDRNTLTTRYPVSRGDILAVMDPALEDLSKKAGHSFGWQTRLLLFGGAAFIVWHVAGMAARGQ
ncbi:MAG: hypothetical protein Q7J32_17490 [Sphingomonadaceae bacterium]|nr:hypothetical protein [Sphingomonadaceae bacterium]